MEAAPGTAPVQLVKRSEWGARRWTRRAQMVISDVRGIVMHHSVTSRTGDPATIMRSIQTFHMDSRGWSDIAYNFCIFPNGDVLEGRGWDNESGATGKKDLEGDFLDDADRRFYSVCFIGDYSTLDGQAGHELTDAQIEAFRRLRVNYLLSVNPDAGAVTTHDQYKATDCPGSNVRSRKNELLMLPQPEAVKSVLPPPPDPPVEPEPGFRLDVSDLDVAIAYAEATLKALKDAREKAS